MIRNATLVVAFALSTLGRCDTNLVSYSYTALWGGEPHGFSIGAPLWSQPLSPELKFTLCPLIGTSFDKGAGALGFAFGADYRLKLGTTPFYISAKAGLFCFSEQGRPVSGRLGLSVGLGTTLLIGN